MSTFSGKTLEYPEFSIDCFDRNNLKAKAYFLSHAHLDHMTGLNSPVFAQRLQSSLHTKLYCSAVTKGLLISNPHYRYLEKYIEDLPNETPKSIELYDDFSTKQESVFVTAIPNGHCPGSVMFLFEGSRGTILYTGDFRLAKEAVKRIEPLHSGTRVKDIKSLYIDTTFCHPSASYLPSREECLEHMIPLVDGWICKSPKHMVRLVCKAWYGYEYLFVELSKRFNTKVHLSDRHYNYYSKVENVSKHLTTCGRTTQIHACRRKDCKMEDAEDVLNIQPSTMWFLSPGNATPRDVIKTDSYKYRLCYSFHSSFSEIRAFVDHICPVNVYPNVIPADSSEEVIRDRLKDLLRGARNTDNIPKYSNLGKLKKRKAIWKKTKPGSGGDEFAKLFDDDDESDDELQKTSGTKEITARKPPKLTEKEDIVFTHTSQDTSHDTPKPDSQKTNSSYCSSYCSDSDTDNDSDLDLFASQESCKLTDSQGPLSQSSHNSDCPVGQSSSLQGGAEGGGDFIKGETEGDVITCKQQEMLNRRGNAKCDDPTGGNSVEGVDIDKTVDDDFPDSSESPDKASGDQDSFNVPATPGAKRPSREQLECMYKKLAAGDDLHIGASSKRLKL